MEDLIRLAGGFGLSLGAPLLASRGSMIAIVTDGSKRVIRRSCFPIVGLICIA